LFKAARGSDWFSRGMESLEKYRTEYGTCRFSTGFMAETHNSHLYAGAHMGLGEDRHSPLALELESTFRYRLIMKRMDLNNT
jgi:hypothetical protein